ATDAVITGTGTVRADDPRFTVRLLPDHPDRRPRPLAVLGSDPSLPAGYVAAAVARGLDLNLFPSFDAMLPVLARAGVLWAMVEAGPRLLDSLVRDGLWDDWLRIEHRGADLPDLLSVSLPPGSDGTTPLTLLPELADLRPAIGAPIRLQEPACSPAS
ncbi:MAG: dihydrofolate reductase family protein, partial [Gluconacetobacter diazotrophicus]|nr:dihydrofolate reductase family protein [Gluconacetobacter diazotrophicus]